MLSTRLRWAGYVARTLDGTMALKFVTSEFTRKRHLRRLRRRWEDTIRMDQKEMGANTRNLVDSAQDKNYWRIFVNAALNLLVPMAI